VRASDTTVELTKALVTLERVIHNPPKTTTAKVKTKTGRGYFNAHAEDGR
jgi:hypothetical protein